MSARDTDATYERTDGVKVPVPPDAAHVVLGMTADDYYAYMDEHGSADVSLHPCMHAHPVLGITAHGHGVTEEARKPHTHRPTTTWDTRNPIPLAAECGNPGCPEHGQPGDTGGGR